MDTAVAKSEYELERDKPVPSKNHSIVQTNLVILLGTKYKGKYRALSEVSIVVSSKEKVPDIAIYPSMEFTPGEDETRLENAPLGVIEILSPSQSLTELITKSAAYFEAGVLSYWLVLPDLRSIYLFSAPGEYQLFAKEDKLEDPRLEIELELKEIFK
ncbi:MAG: Uma2 family endonuclease [Phaeodactylibacter sp.]|nr:Uma2 family endonuclease [Phaeodactylibacter sp.]MCB9263951.1 Uma2 family endonuclease [Lewinellaceae bacterium]MCB9289947.1 Uma2 family endonuclease [Lewinellaceae bacterium]